MDANRHTVSEFTATVERYSGALRRYLFHLTGGNSFAADDLAQEAFIKAYKNWHTCHSSRQAWLFRIAYRTFLDTQRAAKAHPTTEISPSYQAAKEHIDILERTIDCLTENEKNFIILAFVEEFSHTDIAEVTGVPLGTVKTTIRRAKEKLKKHLRNEQL